MIDPAPLILFRLHRDAHQFQDPLLSPPAEGEGKPSFDVAGGDAVEGTGLDEEGLARGQGSAQLFAH